MTKRVVVTGLGVVSSIGIGKEEFWQALLAGKSGISEIASFDTSSYPTHRGGEIRNFEAAEFISREKIDKIGRASSLAIAAAKLALGDAGLKVQELNSRDTGVILGTTMGESQVLEKLNNDWIKRGNDAVDARFIPAYPCNVLSAHLAIELGLQGPNYVIPNACAAGNFCIGYAADLLKKGAAGKMLAGGSDAFSRIAFMGFNRLYAIAPEECRPFDKNRKGMMVGEGAAVLVLETLEDALAREADIYAEILGYGVSCDAAHMTAPSSEGMKEAIEKALAESDVNPQDIDYFNAHGTGTPANDREECRAIKKVFGKDYKKIAVSSIKSMLGHTMGAASAIEAAACALSVKKDIVPPTINYQTPDPECDIDCVPNASRSMKVDIALNNASAFGGNNSCLLLKKV